MTAPQATLVVRFGDDVSSDAFAVAEFDEILNVDATGQEKTTWQPGDTIHFWVQHDPSLRIGSVLPTGKSGEVINLGPVQRTREQELSWPDPATVLELSHLPDRMPELTWYGLPGKGLALSGRSMSISGDAPCTCDARIPITVQLYRYIPPVLSLASSEDKYRVILYITMEAA